MSKEDDLIPFSDDELREELQRRWGERDREEISTGTRLAAAVRTFLNLDGPARAVSAGSRWGSDQIGNHSPILVRNILALKTALDNYEEATDTAPKNIFQ